MAVPGSALKGTEFEPEVRASQEQVWMRALAAQPRWQPAEGPLLVVAPHPDAETLAAGGLIHQWSRSRRVTVLSVTDGERSHPHWPRLCKVRRFELRNALRALGVEASSIIRLGLPDGRVAEHWQIVQRAVRRLSANATIIAPFEWDGHPDHEAVGQVCLEVASSHRVPIARYPIWAWHHAQPKDFADSRWGVFDLSDEAQQAKAQALRCYNSQLQSHRGEPVIPENVRTSAERPFEAFLL
jgi:LmbE family N-acetylglucosaminyl deacetylase